MKLTELQRCRSILILGLGKEGKETLYFLKKTFPDKEIGLSDQLSLEELSPEVQRMIESDHRLRLHLGRDYLSSLTDYDVIIKSPGVPPSLPAIREAIKAGKTLTSHTAIFFANSPGMIIGITGTKGKGTASSLIHAILKKGGLRSYLVGNIGNPPLALINKAEQDTIFVYELSSHQLQGLKMSPHIAVFLNIMPEHLDYYGSFNKYLEAKENITHYQSESDYFVYNTAYPLLREIADRTRAKKIPYSIKERLNQGCFVEDGYIVYSWKGENTPVIKVDEIRLPGRFNLENVLPGVIIGHLLKIPIEDIAKTIKEFEPLPYRLELVGTFLGITFYNDPLATIPEATISGLEALGSDVETLLLGGYDRGLDFSNLAQYILKSGVKTLILFPTTGQRIWETISAQQTPGITLPRCFFVDNMQEAVSLAYHYTPSGKICLHSPASPSFGLFKDYQERGDLFREYVNQVGKSLTDPGKLLAT